MMVTVHSHDRPYYNLRSAMRSQSRANGDTMNLLILVVDDEPDVEMLFRQHFRRAARETLHHGICSIGRYGASAHR